MDNKLIHWGIKGQKWGVRRYENPDGTLTKAGMKRYHRGQYLNDIGHKRFAVKSAWSAATAAALVYSLSVRKNKMNMINKGRILMGAAAIAAYSKRQKRNYDDVKYYRSFKKSEDAIG